MQLQLARTLLLSFALNKVVTLEFELYDQSYELSVEDNSALA